ncbi:MAG TPA: PAS domain S-box protein [Porticoccaceae bacterium]|nr:PAS domain S-box protein [Porticoccaceae bacterium]
MAPSSTAAIRPRLAGTLGIVLLWLLMVVILVTDSLTQLGFAHGILYPPVVLLALRTRRLGVVLAIAGAATVFTVIGFFLSPPAPPGFDMGFVVMNRLLSIVGILVSASLGVSVLRHGERLEAVNQRLRDAQADLERNTELLAIAGEVAHLGGWSLDVPRNLATWTEETRRIHGLDLGVDFDPAQAFDLYCPEDRPRIEGCLRRCIDGGEPFDDEFRIHRPDGQVVWLRVIGRPVRGAGGAVVGVQGAAQDISARKAAEHSLAHSEARFRQLAEAMPMIVWTAEPDGRVDFSSQRMFDYTGVPRDQEAAGQQRSSFPHPDDRATAQAAWRRAIDTGGPFSVEIRLRRHDGEYRWHLLRASLARDADGKPLKWFGTTIDIHDERRRGMEFEALAQRLNTTLESITDGFITLDREWRFTYLNSQAERIIRVRRDQVLGRSLWDVLPEAVGTVFEERYREAMGTQQATTFEAYYEPLDLWADIKAYPSTEGLAIYFQDTTLRRKLEHQLRESQRLEAVGQLTGGMAHDFNNLLTVILGNAEILSEELPPESPLRGLAAMVASAAQRGADLTQRLLAFARRQALEPQVLDINQLVSGLDGLLRRTLGGHIEIEWVRAPGLWPALVDPVQLESALLNLAINARDAMAAGGRLTIETANTRLDSDYARTHSEVIPGQYVLVAVSDTGCGIPADRLSRVFEPFFTTKEVGKGTGLGLSMVFGFVKQSGGHISIYSEPEEGTTVKMYLPRAHRPGDAPASPDSEDAASPGSGQLILLVEDDDLVRDYAAEQLSSAGYRVLQAANGPEALAVLRGRDDIDLLFTDVVMPGGMSGRVLADQALALRPGLKVLYTSGYTENAIVHQGRLDPGVRLLNKPYRRGALLEKVRQVLAEG